MKLVELVNLTVNHIDIEDLPLGRAVVTMELKNFPTAYVNALRRTLTDEMIGYSLQLSTNNTDFKTTDNFLLLDFINERIILIPIKPLLTKQQQSSIFSLYVNNNTSDVIEVTAEDLVCKGSGLLFNPSNVICTLNPGCMLSIDNISISSGMGHARYNRVFNARYEILDIKQYDRKETHLPTGSQASKSGFTVSSLVADPQHFRLRFEVAAVEKVENEITSLIKDACVRIKERVTVIKSYLEAVDKAKLGNTISYSVVQSQEHGLYIGELTIQNETDTIGELLKKTIYMRGCESVTHRVSSHEKELKIVIKHNESIDKILKIAIVDIIETFTSLITQLSNYNI